MLGPFKNQDAKVARFWFSKRQFSLVLVPDSEEFFSVEVIDSVIRITVVVKFLKKNQNL